MKILFLAPNAYMSGRFTDMIFAPRELAVGLVNGLVHKGHTVTFVTAPDMQTQAKLLAGDEQFLRLLDVARTQKNGIDVRMVDAIRRDYEIDLILKAVKEAKEGEYDVVHIFQKDLAHFFDELFHPIPTIYTLHDPVPEAGTLSDALYARFRSHHFVAISNSQKETYKGFDIQEVIHHGIDASKYPFNPVPHKRFVFMGRMVAEKGLGDAIKASVVTNTKLLVASEWNDGSLYGKSVEELVDNPMIETLGVVDQKQRAAMLGRSRALLFPIQWEEPFGMVMIEAMACGTPVIAYRRGSVPELVRDGITGFIVDPKDGVEGLIAAMKKVDSIDRSACRAHVEERFSLTQMVEGYERVYLNLGKR